MPMLAILFSFNAKLLCTKNETAKCSPDTGMSITTAEWWEGNDDVKMCIAEFHRHITDHNAKLSIKEFRDQYQKAMEYSMHLLCLLTEKFELLKYPKEESNYEKRKKLNKIHDNIKTVMKQLDGINKERKAHFKDAENSAERNENFINVINRSIEKAMFHDVLIDIDKNFRLDHEIKLNKKIYEHCVVHYKLMYKNYRQVISDDTKKFIERIESFEAKRGLPQRAVRRLILMKRWFDR